MSCNKYDFNGKVVLVTGSSSGIGAASALQFAKYGAHVTIHGRDAKALDDVAKKMKQVSGNEPLQVVGDLLDQSVPDKLIQETVNKFGRLDVLVNNAGLSTVKGNFSNAEFMDAYDNVMTVNLRSVAKLIHLAVPHLEKTKGNIVNVSSVASEKPFSPVYSVSKAALDMITKSAAQELGPKGIRVNSVNPGPVKTQLGRSYGMPNFIYEHEELVKTSTSLERVGEPDDIANVISFLASDDAVNMTGSIVVSDGGTLIHRHRPNVNREHCHQKCPRKEECKN